tara:strand:+ start:1188 stop:1514 length:327 start_codon:yes stop_codon:yes gene_type:complete
MEIELQREILKLYIKELNFNSFLQLNEFNQWNLANLTLSSQTCGEADVTTQVPPVLGVFLLRLTMTHKRILITEGAGFIASHVAHLIAEKYPSYKVKVDWDILWHVIG